MRHIDDDDDGDRVVVRPGLGFWDAYDYQEREEGEGEKRPVTTTVRDNLTREARSLARSLAFSVVSLPIT